MSQTAKSNVRDGGKVKTNPKNVQNEKVDDKDTKQEKNLRGKLTVPELPGSMKYMLADEKGEDRDLIRIKVTFFKKNLQEIVLVVQTPKGNVDMTPSAYEIHKEEAARRRKIEAEKQASQGFVKKLAGRCLIFVKEVEERNITEVMHVKQPKIVQGILAMTQKEFSTKFPSPDHVLEYWFNQSQETMTEVEKYAEACGDTDLESNVRRLYEISVARQQKKAEKTTSEIEKRAKVDVKSPSTLKPGEGWSTSLDEDPFKNLGSGMEAGKAPAPTKKAELTQPPRSLPVKAPPPKQSPPTPPMKAEPVAKQTATIASVLNKEEDDGFE